MIFLFAISFAQAEEIAKAIYVKGNVKYIHQDIEGILQQGQKLQAGDEIITSEQSLAIISYVNNSKVKIDPSTHIIIEDLEPVESGQKMTLFVKLGQLMIEFINPNKDSQLQVRARNAALGVRGTKFLMGVDDSDNNVHVSVDEGSVVVMSTESDDHESVASGQALVVEEGRRLTRPYVAEWSKSLDWKMDENETGFRQRELRVKRVQEFLKRRPQLVQRRPQVIAPLLKQRFQWQENQRYRGLPKKEALKKYLKKSEVKKDREKNRRKFKDRIKDRIQKPPRDREQKPPKPPSSGTTDSDRN